MLNKIKLANKILLSLLISFGLFVTGISFYSDWKNGDVKKDNLLSEMGSRVLLAGKAAYNPELSGENNEQSIINTNELEETDEVVEAIDENGIIQTAVLMNSGELEFKVDLQEADEVQEEKEQKEQEQMAQEAALKDVKFSFAAIGDAEMYSSKRGYEKELSKVLKKAEDDQPDFFLFTGDLIVATNNISEKVKGIINLIKKYHNNYYIAFGEHDLECGRPCVEQWKETMFGEKIASNDPGNMFHSFNFENTHFILLSTDWPTKHTIDQAQFDWLKQDLEKVDRAKIKNIIVAQHVPPITFFHKSAKNCYDMSCDKVMQKKLLDVYKKYKVDLVLSGHEHVFDHKVKDGIHFVLVGSVGQGERHEGMAKGDIYSLVKVEGEKINLFAYNAENDKLVREIKIKE